MAQYKMVIVLQLGEKDYHEAVDEAEWIRSRINQSGTYRDSHGEYLSKMIVIDKHELLKIHSGTVTKQLLF